MKPKSNPERYGTFAVSIQLAIRDRNLLGEPRRSLLMGGRLDRVEERS